MRIRIHNKIYLVPPTYCLSTLVRTILPELSGQLRAVQKGGANSKDDWSGPEGKAVVAAAAAAVATSI